MKEVPSWRIAGRHLAAFSLLVSVFVACGDGSAGTEVGGVAPDGYQRVANSKAGFSMVVPDGWTVVDADQVDNDSVMASLEETMPQLGDMADQMRAALDQGVVFWAFDYAGARPSFVDNINVIRAPRAGMSAETLRQMNVEQVRSLLDPNATASVDTTMQGYEVIRLAYASASLGTKGYGAIVLTDDTQWVISLTTALSTRPAYDFDVIVDLFREA